MAEELIPLSAYVHLPWCVRKCPYCDFNSHEMKSGTLSESAYLAALKSDIAFEACRDDEREVETVFFGGGTPSLFSAEAFEIVLKALSKELNLSRSAEITLEANPGTMDSGRFTAYRKVGINRLSIGVQSFDDDLLKTLGRIHDAAEAISAFEVARESGFENINLDLMHGLPGQNLAMARADLEQAIDLEPEHLSWYQLTLEPNTVFYSKPPTLPTDELCWEIQEMGKQMLESAGYRQYEVSAWSRDGKACRHNMNYWQFGDYYGLGAGAHAKLSNEDAEEITRYQRHRIPEMYMEQSVANHAISKQIVLQEEDLVLEFMMNALRLNCGFSTTLFTQRTGLDINNITHLLDQAAENDLLNHENGNIRASSKGMNFLNDLLAIFLPGAGKNE